MADKPQPKQPEKRVSKSFIFSSLILLAGIGIILFLVLRGSNNTQNITPNQFVEKVTSNEIVSVDIAEHSTIVDLTGKAVKDTTKPATDKDNAYEYKVSVSKTYFQTVTFDFDYATIHYDDKTLSEVIAVVEASDPEGNNFKVTTTDVYQVTFWDEWGPTIIMLGGAMILAFFLFGRLLNTASSSNDRAISFNQSRARKITNCKVKFSDVAGAEEEKAELAEVVSYLKDPTSFTKFGAKLPKGILLVGNPGCGKTLLAKAVAGEAGVPFFSVSGSDFVEMFVGVGAGRVRDMFQKAKQSAPCLIFIDEIDAVGRQRGAGLGNGNDEREQTLNQLLVELDGFNDNSGVIVMAATNRDDVLDPALLRSGRFDRKITVNLPDRAAREEIFKVHARGKTLAPDIRFDNLAKRTVGFSGADIENIMNEAAILAVRGKKPYITLEDIDEAIDRRVAGIAKKTKHISEHEREMIAYHEAGHAIIGLNYPHSHKVEKITIIPRGNTGGHVRTSPEEDRFMSTRNELIAEIVCYLGGRSSEEIFFDDVSSGASNDIEVATAIARLMVCEYGMSPLGPIQYERNTGSVFLGRDYTNTQKNFSVDTATKIDAEIRKIIDEAHEDALKCLNDHKDDVILLAKTLLEYEQITSEEISYLLEHRQMPGAEKPKVEEAKVEEKPKAPKKETKEKAPAAKKAPSKKSKKSEEK